MGSDGIGGGKSLCCSERRKRALGQAEAGTELRGASRCCSGKGNRSADAHLCCRHSLCAQMEPHVAPGIQRVRIFLHSSTQQVIAEHPLCAGHPAGGREGARQTTVMKARGGHKGHRETREGR